jgi:hypothetical protein
MFMSKLPDVQASVFAESVGDLRNIIDILLMLNRPTARTGPGGRPSPYVGREVTMHATGSRRQVDSR